MSDSEMKTVSNKMNYDALIKQQINSLVEQYPRMVDKGLINSKEIIEASDKLSRDIIEGFRQRLAP